MRCDGALAHYTYAAIDRHGRRRAAHQWGWGAFLVCFRRRPLRALQRSGVSRIRSHRCTSTTGSVLQTYVCEPAPIPRTRSVALRCVPRVVLMHGVGGGGARARKRSTSPAQTVTSTSNAATGISQSSSHVSQNVAAFEQGPRKQTSTAAARNKGKPKATNDSETSDHLESLCTTLITRASAFAPLGAPKASGGGHFADARRNAGWSGAVARKSAHPRSEVENHGGETGARARRSLLTRARPS